MARTGVWVVCLVGIAWCILVRLDQIQKEKWQDKADGGLVYESRFGQTPTWHPSDSTEDYAFDEYDTRWENLYNLLQARPGDSQISIMSTCDEILRIFDAKTHLSAAEKKKSKKIRRACVFMRDEEQRCRYDYHHRHRDGLWEGYVTPCQLIDSLRKVRPFLEQRLVEEISRLKKFGMYSDAAQAKAEAEYERRIVQSEEEERVHHGDWLDAEKKRRVENDKKTTNNIFINGMYE